MTGGTLAPDSYRNVKIVTGQLYGLTAGQGAFGNRGLYAAPAPLPTTDAQALVPVDVEGSTTNKG